jgi:peptidoglycan hydrolase-like protein with peptidoglycan-binding domain
MAYTYTLIDGQRVEASTVAPAFGRLAEAFRQAWGLTLHVRSGTRTWKQQYDLWYGWTNRLPGFNLALHPDDANALHVETNPYGSRALDVYDSGSDAGASVAGSRRNNWLRDNAPRFGFTMSGLTFNPVEGWHMHYTGTIGGGGSPAGGGSSGFPARDRYGEAWVRVAQDKLNRLGFNAGTVDGYDGPQTQTATKGLQAVLGVDQDGIYGPVTNGGADVILAGGNFTNRPVEAIQAKVGATPDGIWGPLTSLAVYKWQKANGLHPDAQWGPISDAKAAFPPDVDERPVGENRTSRPVKEIQAAVGMPEADQDGIYGPETTAYVIAWQTNQGIDADGIWGMTSDGLKFPPAGSIHGVDYSFARPDVDMLAKRGVKLAGRYLWQTKYDDGRTNKGIGLEELLALRSRDIGVFFIYERDGKELRGGFAAGVEVARAAEGWLTKLGLAGHPIYFNVDYDAPAEDMPQILAALDGIASVIGLGRVGLYAGFGPLKAAFDAGKIKWGFQTYAWSGGKWDPRAQLQQWSNGQWGGTVDFTRAMTAEYGQNPVAPVPLPDPDPEPDPAEPVEVSAERAAQIVAASASLASLVAETFGEG